MMSNHVKDMMVARKTADNSTIVLEVAVEWFKEAKEIRLNPYDSIS